MEIKPVLITERDVAVFLANKPRTRRKKAQSARPTAQSPHKEITDEFLRNFSAKKLLEVLVDSKKKPIDVEWIIGKLLKLYDSAQKTADKIKILEKFQEFMLLGAIQSPELLESMTRKLADAPKQMKDPFMGHKTNTLKIAKG